ncbi:hypothetical protein C8R44DRAFT_740113 [Mycena epipterygia]|nr:hypothetical protein C8R44DRAFT_740113 [Mycena epipterygia]
MAEIMHPLPALEFLHFEWCSTGIPVCPLSEMLATRWAGIEGAAKIISGFVPVLRHTWRQMLHALSISFTESEQSEPLEVEARNKVAVHGGAMLTRRQRIRYLSAQVGMVRRRAHGTQKAVKHLGLPDGTRHMVSNLCDPYTTRNQILGDSNLIDRADKYCISRFPVLTSDVLGSCSSPSPIQVGTSEPDPESGPAAQAQDLDGPATRARAWVSAYTPFH